MGREQGPDLEAEVTSFIIPRESPEFELPNGNISALRLTEIENVHGWLQEVVIAVPCTEIREEFKERQSTETTVTEAGT